MASVGVIGGGQLARMMTPPAINLGLEIKVLAEAAGSSAALATTQVGDYTHLDVVREFAATVDVITFDHDRTTRTNRSSILCDLVPFRKIGIEIVFTCKMLVFCNRTAAGKT